MVFFFNDTATTEIYTLSLHDALPIYDRVVDPARGDVRRARGVRVGVTLVVAEIEVGLGAVLGDVDRKSTRLNSSHANISYAVFCLKKNTTNFPRAPRSPAAIDSILTI